jgi:hypothetical protein
VPDKEPGPCEHLLELLPEDIFIYVNLAGDHALVKINKLSES